MYERMLNKQCQPSFDELAEHCGVCMELFRRMNGILMNGTGTDSCIRFPYGNSYGWGVKYTVKNKHICDVFAEKDAFTVMLRLTNSQYASVYSGVSAYTKAYIDNKYPCGEGGWIHYRVLTEENLTDIENLLRVKLKQ